MTPYESGLVCAHASSHSSIHLENYRILARKLILSQPQSECQSPYRPLALGSGCAWFCLGKADTFFIGGRCAQKRRTHYNQLVIHRDTASGRGALGALLVGLFLMLFPWVGV